MISLLEDEDARARKAAAAAIVKWEMFIISAFSLSLTTISNVGY